MDKSEDSHFSALKSHSFPTSLTPYLHLRFLLNPIEPGLFKYGVFLGGVCFPDAKIQD